MSTWHAVADLTFDTKWDLPPAGADFPSRYWAHIRFLPKNAEPELWTVFVEPSESPDERRRQYSVKLFFMPPSAPCGCLQTGKEITLYIGDIVKVHGVVKCVAEEE
jgi:hypothetical protein